MLFTIRWSPHRMMIQEMGGYLVTILIGKGRGLWSFYIMILI
ncbi:hypothetical protein F383_30155 [Gossypium arboreum]|uniref:Uncharacterized protein n=1 Tax=Gossypium arboreum TaxID=29729 RepID=A0A0B0PJZ0_GOSAR|nr:hypothetical protein F383_30155 [Gossypium arboreum]